MECSSRFAVESQMTLPAPGLLFELLIAAHEGEWVGCQPSVDFSTRITDCEGENIGWKNENHSQIDYF